MRVHQSPAFLVILNLFPCATRSLMLIAKVWQALKFICFLESLFLLRGVEHHVAILSLALARESDRSQVSAIFILCLHVTK